MERGFAAERTGRPSIVYRGLTQDELDAQYDQRTAVPDVAAYARRWSEWSDAVRRSWPPQVHDYGEGPTETLDLFNAEAPAAAHLHLHGGAWKALSKRDAGFVARGLSANGAAVAVADFSLAPEVALSEMVAQARRAFLWLRDWAGARGIPVSVSGHSSGAHLAACLLHRDWWRETGLTAEDFASVTLVSGIYDLEPVRLSARNTYLNLSERDVETLSPIRNLPQRCPPVAVLWGEHELAEFRRQSRTYAEAVGPVASWMAARELPGVNHFDLYDAFFDPTSEVSRIAQSLAREAVAEKTGKTRR